jgi:hypothetical protein
MLALTKHLKLDKRTRVYRFLHHLVDLTVEYIKEYHLTIMGAITLGLLIAFISVGWTIKQQRQASRRPAGLKIEKRTVVKTVAAEERYCGDPISYIRCKGEELGEPNEDIKTMIRIAKAESGYNPRAKNPTSTASGIFQIVYGTWNGNDCQGNAFGFKNNIDCARKLLIARGFQPWVASKAIWNTQCETPIETRGIYIKLRQKLM